VLFIRRVTDQNKKIVAFATLSTDVDKAELLVWCKNEMPGYMVPSDIIVLDDLAVTPNTKIDKVALLHIFENQLPGQNN